MKLRTELSEIGLTGAAFGLRDMAHDAMAAHALLQAMDEEIEQVPTLEYNSRATCAHFMVKVKERAARILASWGVEQEVAG